jgi:transposase-like protein
MVRTHPSTPEQRAQWTAYMLAHQGDYGIVTHLSREAGVSRPTLYAWREQAQRALVYAFTPTAPPPSVTPALERQVLTLLVHAHASARGIQTCIQTLTDQGLSLDTITAILHEAQQRARSWVQTHVPPTRRALALDEIYANDRRGAYLNVVDVHSGAVWAAEGPLPVDAESWTLVLWSLQDRQLCWDRVVLDDGAALHAACAAVTPDLPLQSDQWHVLQACAQVQARLDRAVRERVTRTAVVERQAARLACGQRPKGRRPQTDVAAHLQEVALAQRTAEAVRFLTHELRRLLNVVVLDGRGVLDAAERQADLDAVLSLLAEVVATATNSQQDALGHLQRRLIAALPKLLTFVAQADRVRHDLAAVLAPERQALLGWAWLRRQRLNWTSQDIVAAIPIDWRSAARVLLTSWDDAVRVSSAVERWHSIVRPHLSVHRTLSTGMLALLAVWHNHRVFTRGIHKGKSPLHLSGMTDAPTDWLMALGYPLVVELEAPAVATDTMVLAA